MNIDPLSFSQANLRDFVEETLGLWHVPGLALAVVKDGQIILEEGYGLRNMALSLPISPNTLFPIASCTKAFTAMALGMLVDAGKMQWDRPVKEVLPNFRLWDAFATERITPRDLLTHRSGLPGHDLMWYATRFTRREIYNRLRFLEPTCDLRTTFQYQNLMFMVAGLLVEEITGLTWQQFIQQRILDPLGMDRTSFSTRTMQQTSDFAWPYRYRNGSMSRMLFQEAMDGENNPLSGAGGIISCASDMAKWLQFLLNHGNINGQSLIAEATFEQMFTPHIFTDDPLARSCFGHEFMSYGLGWGMRSQKGRFLVEHDGMADGFYSLVSMMPRSGLGVVALSNCDAYYNPVQDNLVPNIVAYFIYDRLLGLEPTNWNERMRAAHDERLLAMEQARIQPVPETIPASPPCHPVESYLGEYDHPGYGRLSICKEGEQLRLVMNHKLEMPLVHCYYDIFEAIFEITGERQKLAFITNLDGEVNQVSIAVEPRVNAILFTRVQDK